jgi:hypothetical protein
MGPPWRRREAVRELEQMMPTYATEHRCLVHDADLPFPDYLKQVQFHGIILGPTFLCARYSPALLRQTMAAYGWIKDSPAVKIALPQDDYDCAGILDRWMVDWRVDLVQTVCPEHWDVLYPTYSTRGKIELGYTGYISERWIRDWAKPKDSDARPIDVSYRATQLPANFGSVGRLKSEIGDRFLRAAAASRLQFDISTKPEDLIPGQAWHAFLENSKCCLTTPSGSSLLDPEGEYRRRVTRYEAMKPRATFDEIAARCFPGEDRKYTFTAISPRNLEAALAETVQIGTPGSYSGVMRPLEHYIPLAEDCSNVASVLELIANRSAMARIARECKAAVLHRPELRFTHRVGRLVDFISDASATRNRAQPVADNIEAASRRYEIEITGVAARHWRRQRLLALFRTTAIKLGARQLRRLLLLSSAGSS